MLMFPWMHSCGKKEHCLGFYILATFWPEGIITISAICLSIPPGPVLRNYAWQLFDFFRTYQPYIKPAHCKFICTFRRSALKIWPSPCTFCLGYCLEAIKDNCFIFSWYINLTWDLCTAGSFWPLTLILWPSHWEILSSHCSSWKLYIPTVSYSQGTWIIHGSCSLWAYFDLWPWYYELGNDKFVWAIAQKLYMATAHIFRAWQSNIGSAHCRVILIISHLFLKL